MDCPVGTFLPIESRDIKGGTHGFGSHKVDISSAAVRRTLYGGSLFRLYLL
jgi:hypothetical protein